MASLQASLAAAGNATRVPVRTTKHADSQRELSTSSYAQSTHSSQSWSRHANSCRFGAALSAAVGSSRFQVRGIGEVKGRQHATQSTHNLASRREQLLGCRSQREASSSQQLKRESKDANSSSSRNARHWWHPNELQLLLLRRLSPAAAAAGDNSLRDKAVRKEPERCQRNGPRGATARWRIVIGAAALVLLLIGGQLSAPMRTWSLTEENLIFLEAWRVVDRAYVDKGFNGQSWFRYREQALKKEPMKSREDTYAAIRKMLASLDDPFTRFLEPDKFRSLKSGTQGEVTGVGLEIGFSSAGSLQVVSPVMGGPADRAGVRPKDSILAIDGHPTAGASLYDAAQRLQGTAGSVVELTVEREGGVTQTFSLTREKVSLNPVLWRSCPLPESSDRIGYIRLSTFNQNSPGALRMAINELRQEGVLAFILDVRNNGGGLFPSGIEIAKMWLKDGIIVYITDSMGVRDIYETNGEAAIATNEPLAVLVNKGTASASEILAGALKDNGRATVLGEPTFGKGKIQSVFELSDGSGLAVTIARYETPNHTDIDKVGIIPNRLLPDELPMDPDDFCSCLCRSRSKESTGAGAKACSIELDNFFPSLSSRSLTTSA